MNPFKEKFNIICETSKKEDGNMSYKYGKNEEVTNNRRYFLKKYDLCLEDCVIMKVEHKEKITIVDFSHKISDNKPFVYTEALITKEKNLVLFLSTADCLPIALYDTEHQVIALAHLGWKSTDHKLIIKVIEKMKNEFGSNPNNIFSYTGPGIHKESYIFTNPIQKTLPNWSPFLTDISDRETQIDIVEYNKQQMLNSGIKEENILIDPIDTAISNEYFSHYRSVKTGETEGRFITILALK